jgi:hypothetical protein
MLNIILLFFVKESLEASRSELQPEIVSDEDSPRKETEALSHVQHGKNLQLEKESYHHDIISEQFMALQVITYNIICNSSTRDM